jgi:hypothetical protein
MIAAVAARKSDRARILATQTIGFQRIEIGCSVRPNLDGGTTIQS